MALFMFVWGVGGVNGVGLICFNSEIGSTSLLVATASTWREKVTFVMCSRDRETDAVLRVTIQVWFPF
jgi:hypothetical protein